MKWQAVAERPGPRHVVVNAEEGEPASAKDRWLLRHRPHIVVEGALAAASAIGADTIWIYVADRPAAESAREAAAELRADTSLGPIPRINVVEVPHTYVAGEETSVVRAIDGGPALPTTKPPRPFERGAAGSPTLVQNAETLAHVALIVRSGAKQFRGAGSNTAPGTLLLTISGDCIRPGLVEVATGTRLREVLALAGGVRGGGAPAGFAFGGYFGGIAGPRTVDLPIEHDALRTEGIGLGCGAVIVLGTHRCVVAVAATIGKFFAAQSAHQCGVCVRGTAAIQGALERLRGGRADPANVEQLQRFAGLVRGRGACALPDGAANVVESLIREFPGTVADHVGRVCLRCRLPVDDVIPNLAARPVTSGARPEETRSREESQ
ncbi:NADH-ubiquinone oxidoreductase-F iron-sulfur binding region domain-containing protein [Pseudonocardia sulfidoxydans]|uniref:NADH-ubiquinone oxidoreductase-F iron-sulfur binding region domain-containing protein n=1 Tax=Pseudonocardia sulfidoxydans TaxID=54011 RepID=UPI0036151A3C